MIFKSKKERDKYIIKLRSKGMSQRAIEDKTGVSRCTIIKVLQGADGYVKGARANYASKYNKDDIIKLRYVDKLTQQQIADKLHCSRGTVVSVLKNTKEYVKGERIDRKAYSRG
jgi:transcriptional regulator with XRE-family HTH domain